MIHVLAFAVFLGACVAAFWGLVLVAAIAGTAAAAFWLGYWVGSIDQARGSLRGLQHRDGGGAQPAAAIRGELERVAMRRRDGDREEQQP